MLSLRAALCEEPAKDGHPEWSEAESKDPVELERCKREGLARRQERCLFNVR